LLKSLSMMTVLRWVLVLPTSFVCGILAAIIALEISRKIVPAKVVTGIIAGAIFVGAGALMAPSHKTETMIALAVINCLYSLSQAKTLALAPGERFDWLSASRALGDGMPIVWDL
jgi:hypothetical protein